MKSVKKLFFLRLKPWTSAAVVVPLLVFLPFSKAFPYLLTEPDIWEASVEIPEAGRPNPFNFDPLKLSQAVEAGQHSSQVYPVYVSGLFLPKKVNETLLNPVQSRQGPFSYLVSLLSLLDVRDLDTLLAWIGLHPYPSKGDSGVYTFSVPDSVTQDLHFGSPNRVGYGYSEIDGVSVATLSCAACHSGNLFGQTVLGMSNRLTRANNFFVKAHQLLTLTPASLIKEIANLSEAEMKFVRKAKLSMLNTNPKKPQALGLDNSLRVVALAMARRSQDSYSSPSPYHRLFPRSDLLDNFVADSKPPVWWNTKFKNRWLSDGSVVSGNPVITALIWNELGRGSSLQDFESWLAQNREKVQELTAAVFQSEAPRVTDFFPAEMIPLERAKNGEALFNRACAKCHGTYEKKWSLEGANQLPLAEQLKTSQVKYFKQTQVKNVGTDPQRFQGMKSLESMNHLHIMKTTQTKIVSQNGYVPPPLVGIWARWPYLHNNSVPTLMDLLTESSQRPKVYYAIEANHQKSDFDFEKNGYPAPDKLSVHQRRRENLFDTQLEGLSNRGHDVGIFIKNGREIFKQSEKQDLIYFLQTL